MKRVRGGGRIIQSLFAVFLQDVYGHDIAI